MPVKLANQLARLTTDQRATVTYEANVDATGVIPAAATWNSWAGNPLVLPGSTIGTGGTLSFSFFAGAPLYAFSAAEISNATQALAIWSGIANVHFVYNSDPTVANVVFVHAFDTFQGATLPKGTAEQTKLQQITATPGEFRVNEAIIGLDKTTTNTPGDGLLSYGDFTSYTVEGGYGIDTLVHEVGHLMGLGHTGPYNGTVDVVNDPNNQSDVRNWSIMSYVDEQITTAKYFGTNSPTYFFGPFDRANHRGRHGDPASRDI